MSNYRPPAKTTHAYCRSFLQKAVRRGQTSLALAIGEHLSDKNVGDGAWLNQRATILAFEECPQAWSTLTLSESKRNGQTSWSRHQALTLIERVTGGTKWKQATGLGVLAHFANDNPETLNDHRPAIRPHVAAVAARVSALGQGVPPETSDQDKSNRPIDFAYRTFSQRQAWPWDKAFMVAANYLDELGFVPNYVPESAKMSCPTWVAVDRHTDLGKRVITEVAVRTGRHRKIVEWTSFYAESALLNAESTATCAGIDWWQEERTWRLGKLGLTIDAAFQVWRGIREEIERAVIEIAGAELSHLEKVAETTPLHSKGIWDDPR
jgi:hypothetical protein